MDLSELYRDVIVDHNRNPRNFRPMPAADSHAADARRDVAKLLDTLPERQRLPIIHMKLTGLSVAQTARLTGMSESAVKVNVHRGLKALAAKMKSET